jgi:hypothetical protein
MPLRNACSARGLEEFDFAALKARMARLSAAAGDGLAVGFCADVETAKAKLTSREMQQRPRRMSFLIVLE